MNIRAKPPIFVPAEYRDELEKLSKAALMDLVWDFAVTSTVGNEDRIVMTTLRKRAEIIRLHRSKP